MQQLKIESGHWIINHDKERILLSSVSGLLKAESEVGQNIATVLLEEVIRLQAELTSRPVTFSRDLIPKAAQDVMIERTRQQEVEGFGYLRDDEYTSGELAYAAAAYALASIETHHAMEQAARCYIWSGWMKRWWKPHSRRRDLVKAGALILAEIERLDRKTGPSVEDL